MTNKIDSALALAQQGFRIFPIVPGTKFPPKDFAWKAEATTDRDRIRQWWKSDPNYNIGVATGGGVVVVDADTKKGKPGLASLAMLDALDLPDSLRVETPSGGMHVYLRTDAQHRNRVDSIAGFEGIDLRSDGGYVLGPGSTLDGKPYKITSALPIASSPAWFDKILLDGASKHKPKSDVPLIELDTEPAVARATQYLIDLAPEAVEGAGGNDTTFRVAARCRDFGITEGTTLELMLDHWNEQKASPVWHPEELADVVGNAFQYATGGWGSADARAEFGELDIDVGERPESIRMLGEVQAEQTRGPFFLNYDAMISMPRPEWLVDGVLQRRTASLLFGKSNTFKSFLAIDIALCVAIGRNWHGRAVSRAGRVGYVATEGAIGVGGQRVPGWYQHYGIDIERRQNFYLHPMALPLDDPKSVGRLVYEMKALGGLDLIVLDIFGGTMNGTEVEDTTARAWVKGAQRLVTAGSTVLTVAHTGWQDQTRARMHTHFWGSFDTRLKVEGDKDKRTAVLEIERHKDADSMGKWGFRLEQVHDTLVPALDATVTGRIGPDLKPSEKAALAALERAIAQKGVVQQGAGWPDDFVVTKDDFRSAALAAGVTAAATEKAQKSALDRILRDLGAKNLVAMREGYIWSSQGVSETV